MKREKRFNDDLRRKELEDIRNARRRADADAARMARMLMVDLSDPVAVREHCSFVAPLFGPHAMLLSQLSGGGSIAIKLDSHPREQPHQ